jgi:nucleoside-diphosphate-sugar epimerase
LNRVLVTGATGLIGRHVVDALLAGGHEVHAVSSRAIDSNRCRWHRADLLEPDAARTVVGAARPTHLLHLAWGMPRVGLWNSPENLNWHEASIRLWREFSASGGGRAVVAGSCAEYEWGEPVLSERSTPLRPATLYGSCKDALRRVLEASARAAGQSLAWARIFFVYGPNDHPDRLVPSVVARLTAGEPAPVTEGTQVRDFLHVRDVATALVALMGSDIQGPVNVGSGEGVAIRDVVQELGRMAGRPELIELGALPRPDGDPDAIIAEVSRLCDELGWSPSVGLREGLADVLAGARPAVR